MSYLLYQVGSCFLLLLAGAKTVEVWDRQTPKELCCNCGRFLGASQVHAGYDYSSCIHCVVLLVLLHPISFIYNITNSLEEWLAFTRMAEPHNVAELLGASAIMWPLCSLQILFCACVGQYSYQTSINFIQFLTFSFGPGLKPCFLLTSFMNPTDARQEWKRKMRGFGLLPNHVEYYQNKYLSACWRS